MNDFNTPPVTDKSVTNPSLNNVSHENKKIKGFIAIIFLGLVLLSIVFVVLVARNVPQEIVWEMDNPDPMDNDVRPARLLEHLAAKGWQQQRNDEKPDHILPELPSESMQESNAYTETINIADQNEWHYPSELSKDVINEETSETITSTSTMANAADVAALAIQDAAAESPILVYHGTATKATNSANDKSALNFSLPAGDNDLLLKTALEAQGSQDPYQQQNQQASKKSFLHGDEQAVENNDIQSSLQKQTSPYTIAAGAVLPATLVTGINSDLPGTVIGKISQAVFDTAIGKYLLIPQGSTLLGRYDSQISFGQSRVLLVWSRLIFPNGDSINLNNMPGVDLQGYSGLTDKVNYHTTRLFGSALLYSTFSAASQLNQSHHDNDKMTAQDTMSTTLAQQMSQTGNQLVEKHLQVQPTIEIRPGTRFTVMLTKDLVLPNAYHH